MFELLCRTRFRHLLDSQHDPRGKGRRKHWNSNCPPLAKSQDFVSKYVLQRGVKIVDQLAEGLVSPQRFFFYWQRTRHHGGTTAELSSKLSRVLCGHVSFQNLPLPCWLLANIATSRLQCRKPSLLKVVNKPALQIPWGATRRCGLSEGGTKSGRRAVWSLRVVSRPKLCFHNLVSLSRGQPLLTPPLSSLTRPPSLYISHFTPCFCAKYYGTRRGI